MNRSTNCLGGSAGFPFRTKKLDNGNYEVTTDAAPERRWEDANEIDAIRTATSEMRDALLRGEISSHF
jgi:hypothetical protein